MKRIREIRLIGIIGSLLLVPAIIGCQPEDEVETVTAGETVVEPIEDVELVPITDVVVVTSAIDVMDMVGREVDLDDLVVQNVMGDVAFTVGPDPQNQVLVILDEEPSPDTPMEGQVDVDTADLIDLTGVIRAMPPLEEARSMWTLEGADEADFGAMQVYIHADTVTVREPQGKAGTEI